MFLWWKPRCWLTKRIISWQKGALARVSNGFRSAAARCVANGRILISHFEESRFPVQESWFPNENCVWFDHLNHTASHERMFSQNIDMLATRILADDWTRMKAEEDETSVLMQKIVIFHTKIVILHTKLIIFVAEFIIFSVSGPTTIQCTRPRRRAFSSVCCRRARRWPSICRGRGTFCYSPGGNMDTYAKRHNVIYMPSSW